MNTICKLNVNVTDNNAELTRETAYTLDIAVHLSHNGKNTLIIESAYNPHYNELEGFYDDEDIAEEFVNDSGLVGVLSSKDMVKVLNETMDYILSTVNEPEFEYESVLMPYAPWSHTDTPPEELVPYCSNPSTGKYVLNVVNDNGEIKVVRE